MRSKTAIILLVLFFASMTLPSQTKNHVSELKWNSFNAGITQAGSSHKKILVDVYTDWCGWCKRMDKEVYADPAVREYLAKNFVVIKINAEGSESVRYKGQAYTPPQLAAAFGVTGYPATLFMKDNSEPITLLPGYMEAPMFLNVLSFIAENHYETKQFDAYLKEKGVKQ